jgi:excisionase family DNA binding protein
MDHHVVVIEPIAVRKPVAARLLDCGLTKVYELIRAGKLATCKVGTDDRVLVASIKQFAATGGEK